MCASSLFDVVGGGGFVMHFPFCSSLFSLVLSLFSSSSVVCAVGFVVMNVPLFFSLSHAPSSVFVVGVAGGAYTLLVVERQSGQREKRKKQRDYHSIEFNLAFHVQRSAQRARL